MAKTAVDWTIWGGVNLRTSIKHQPGSGFDLTMWNVKKKNGYDINKL